MNTIILYSVLAVSVVTFLYLLFLLLVAKNKSAGILLIPSMLIAGGLTYIVITSTKPVKTKEDASVLNNSGKPQDIMKADSGMYEIDADHTFIGFEVKHIVSDVHGVFNEYSGSVTFGRTQNDFKMNVTINTAGINTGNTDRDEHLRTADYFDAAKFPQITFASEEISAADTAGYMYKAAGDLTMHGITKPVAVYFNYLGTVVQEEYKIAGFKGETSFTKGDFKIGGEKGWAGEVKVALAVEAVK